MERGETIIMDNDKPLFYKGRRVLVTGGVGFIGSNLAARLVVLGADVLLVDSLGPDYGGNLFNIDAIRNDVRVNISGLSGFPNAILGPFGVFRE